MCCKILVNGEHEIETPAEFVDFFGFEPIYDKLYNGIVMDACLCQVDIETTIKTFGLNETSKYDGEWHYLKYENTKSNAIANANKPN